MESSRTLTFRVACFLSALLLAGFVVLSLDVTVRIWLLRGRLGSGVDAALLLSYEAARTLTTVLALVLALASYRRAATAGLRAFTLLLLFLALWYTKAFAFEGYPGHLQEAIAEWLFRRGVPPGAAAFVFGEPVWAAWLALGALLRVSVSFPGPLDAAAIERSGVRDRTGMLRGVSIAGTDVGAILRRVSAALLRRGLFRAGPVWLLSGVAGPLHALTGNAAVRGVLVAGFCGLTVLALTNLRAATLSAPASERRRALWMLQAAIVAAIAFATSAILSTAAGPLGEGISFGLAALGPPVVLMGMAHGIVLRRPPDPRPAVTNTLLVGVAATASAAVYALSARVVTPLAQPAVAAPIAIALAAGCTALLWPRIRRLAGRLSASVFAAT